MLNKQQIKENFSRSAAVYDDHADLQRRMADHLFSILTTDPSTSLGASDRRLTTILDIGCGTGYLAERLARAFPQAKVLGIDLAPGMIEVARQKHQAANLSFAVGDGESLGLPGRSFDLIVSNASLQWMAPEQLFREVGQALAPGGSFVFSTFGPQTLSELTTLGLRVNAFLSLDELRVLAGQYFDQVRLEAEVHKISFVGPRELHAYLKGLGAQTVSRGMGAGACLPAGRVWGYRSLRNKKELTVTFEALFAFCADLTYHLGDHAG